MTASTRTGGRDATTAVVPGSGVLSIGNPRTATPTDYEWTPLEAVARLESGHTPSRARDDYWDGGIPWIGIRDATGHHGEVIQSTFQSVSQLGVDNSSTRLLPQGTVCLSRTASVGYVVQMGVPMCTSQDFVNWVCSDGLRNDYLRYALMVEAESVRRWAYGSTHKTLYYPEAKALHLLMPGRSVQDAVAEVLGALDDKIAANRRIVASSLSVCVALARDGATETQPLETVAEIVMGTSPRGEDLNTEGVGLPFFQGVRDFGDLYPAERVYTGALLRVADAGDTLFAVRAPVGELNIARGRLVIGRGLAAIRAKTHPLTLHYALRAHPELWSDFQDSGTVFASINGPALRARAVFIPPAGKAEALERGLEAIHARAVSAAQENERIAATRDELLPLLMNGTITVKDAESTVGKVI